MVSRAAWKAIFVPIVLVMVASETISKIVFDMKRKNRRAYHEPLAACRIAVQPQVMVN